MNKNLFEVSKQIYELPRKIFPDEDNLTDLPTVDELKMLGMENLMSLKSFSEDALATCETNLLQFWGNYVDRVLIALSLSEPRPMIPDFRDINWVVPDDQVLVNLSDYETGAVKKRNFAYGAVNAVKIPDIEKAEMNIYCRVNPERWQVDEVTYELHSPCIIKSTDVEYFRENPYYLDLWLEFVGCCDPERKLDRETKCAMREQIIGS